MNKTNRPILLVEDDPADARLIQRAFEKAQLPVPLLRLSNGDDAVAYLAGEGPYHNRISYPLPTLMLLDIKLPRRSGFEVLEWVRNRADALARLVVVMLTSSGHSVDVDRAYDLGANSYITKPENSQRLLEVAHVLREYWLKYNQFPEAGA